MPKKSGNLGKPSLENGDVVGTALFVLVSGYVC